MPLSFPNTMASWHVPKAVGNVDDAHLELDEHGTLFLRSHTLRGSRLAIYGPWGEGERKESVTAPGRVGS